MSQRLLSFHFIFQENIMKSSLIGLVFLTVAFAAILIASVPVLKAGFVGMVKELGHTLNRHVFNFQITTGQITGLVTLRRDYGGYSSGQTVGFNKSLETALIASGTAVAATVAVTPGALSTNQPSGSCAIAAGASSVVITNSLVTDQSVIHANLNQAAADGTLLYIARIVPTNGSFTIYGNAAATAQIRVDWSILFQGNLSQPS